MGNRQLAVTLLCMSLSAYGQDWAAREQGRSMTMTTDGIVATSQTLASQAGAEALAAGGSAVDAAIAANAVLTVVEPMMSGIGGDLFAMVWADGKLSGLNASGWSPKGLTIEALRKAGLETMPRIGIHSVTVPGAAGGWRALHQRYGRLSWRELFRAAIHYAEHGFPVTERVAAAWAQAGSKDIALQPPRKAGELHRNRELAGALRILAEKGPEAVYRGEIANAMLETSMRAGGKLDAADLSEWQPEWVEPIASTYRGWTVYELPPNGSGVAALEMLNVMESREFPAGSVDALHWRVEAMKLAFADVWATVSDPRFVRVPVKQLLSKEYAKRRAGGIDMAHAACRAVPGDELATDGNTIYLAAVDRDGMMVSLIQSIATLWGSGVVVEGMGFPLQNRGSYFRMDAGHVNALAGRKRPFHTIIPALMERGGERIAFGIMGGPGQPYSHAQFVSNVADYGMNIQAALDAPRFRGTRENDCEVGFEDRIGAAAIEGLRRRGHEVQDLGAYDLLGTGVGQAVMRDRRGVNYGASDARGDGAAVPEAVRR